MAGEADWAPLLLAAAAGLSMRIAGVLMARRMRPDHPFVAWAGALAGATLAAFVVIALVSPSSPAASVPPLVRAVGLGAALLAYFRWGLLAGLAAGITVLSLLAAALAGQNL